VNFAFDDELLMLRDSVRRFVQDELMPLEAQYANEPDIPDTVRTRLQARAMALGFWAFDLPASVGGGGIGYVGACLVFEELARCNVPSFRAQTVLTPYLGPVLFHGTADQQRRYLLPVVRGEKRTCFALTEPNGGSDPSGMRTRAVREGDGYRINGAKTFITGADKADFVQLFARTVHGGDELGVSCFLVDKGTPGLRLGQRFDLMSPDQPWEVVFEDVYVPAQQLVGSPGSGWALAHLPRGVEGRPGPGLPRRGGSGEAECRRDVHAGRRPRAAGARRSGSLARIAAGTDVPRRPQPPDHRRLLGDAAHHHRHGSLVRALYNEPASAQLTPVRMPGKRRMVS
jgi:hypothetical protein